MPSRGAAVAIRYYRELLSYFTRSVNDRDAAADVVQEAYTRVLALQRSGGMVLQPRALLYHVGRNIVATRATRQAAEKRMLDTLSLIACDSSPSAEREAMAREQLELLLELLGKMPGKRRDVFVLVRIHGYSYQQAGERMGLSQAAVEKHVMRGIIDCAAHAGLRR